MALRALLKYLAVNFFVMHSSLSQEKLCLYPDLNIDRGGTGTREERKQYERYQAELEQIVANVADAYGQYRRLIKTALFL